MASKFENLKVWERAVDLSVGVHEATRGFPKEELYVLTSQMKRAADSVSLNIAEGSTGQSDAEFGRFLGYAIRSTIEVVGCLYLGRRRGILDEESYKAIYDECEEIFAMLNGLRNSLSI